MSTSVAGPQIYELVTSNKSERETWMDRIHKAQEWSKKRGPSSRRGGKVVIPRTPIAEEEDEKPRYGCNSNLCEILIKKEREIALGHFSVHPEVPISFSLAIGPNYSINNCCERFASTLHNKPVTFPA